MMARPVARPPSLGRASAPGPAQQQIERVDDAEVLARERRDGRTEDIPGNIRDLQRIEHHWTAFHNEMRSDVAV